MLRWILNRFDLYSEERYIRESRVKKSVYFPEQVGLHKAHLGGHGPRPHAIILVHGFASKHWIWDDFISCVKQDTASSDFDFYSFEYDAFWESPVNLDDAALALAQQIERVRSLNHHQNIILIGHSIGGLVARAAVLYGRGARGTEKYRWAEENCLRRLVLIASLNRGTRYFEQHRFQRFLAGVKYKPKGRPFFLEQFLHGSPFVTNLRLDWIVEFSGSKNPPEVVQVYGEADGSHKGDRWVTRDDSEDLLSLP